MKFIADCHLGKIAKYLRIFGFDTLYFQSIDDDDIIEIAQKEERVLLTSDKVLYERMRHHNALYLAHAGFEEHLREIFYHYKLFDKVKPLSICIKCNGELEEIDKLEIIDELKAKTKKYFDTFARCKECGRVYWHGDHYKNMLKFVDEFIAKYKKETEF
ncbi:Mut7-C RNAse domain-containing protein [Sulfurimonas sp.]|uniref:Mut7-C RNAse domain-containing protein n=1 Tax=Sulfurimonas sp. TaxID=2022749 RepID=UPI0019E1E0D4|nr:Mut7-C RNAse domain-containing protein [Sulfurimonas sp.]MBE0515082.1 Mut7-C RNAse domain-containing protein [Sulfurimonas sp.]